MLFSPLESANAEAANTLKCEDVVSFYHKHFAAYLSYDPSVQATPMYYASERINVKSRCVCVCVCVCIHPLYLCDLVTSLSVLLQEKVLLDVED